MDLKTILEITSLPFIISTVAADGLAPVGARASADTVMTRSSPVYTKSALEGLIKSIFA